jgi:hypothetical protein
LVKTASLSFWGGKIFAGITKRPDPDSPPDHNGDVKMLRDGVERDYAALAFHIAEKKLPSGLKVHSGP